MRGNLSPEQPKHMSASRTQLGKFRTHDPDKSRGDTCQCKGILFVVPKVPAGLRGPRLSIQ